MNRSFCAVLGGALGAAILVVPACGPGPGDGGDTESRAAGGAGKYATVRLTSDLSHLTDRDRRMIPILIQAAEAMDEVFWIQAYGDRDGLLSGIGDPELRRFAEINYGPWDRLDGNAPFLPGVGPKPEGANFYPADMAKEEFEAAAGESPERAARLRSLYTLVRRDAGGRLAAVPYHEAFAAQVGRAAERLREAAEIAEDPGLRRYLELRARALLTDEYRESDLAWMDMKENRLDVVIGPIETYEDQLFGYKAAHAAYVLVKDPDWSRRLSRYAAFLPALQRGLPVPEAYRREEPGADSDLNVYDAVYYAGDCNAGSKTIAINLPNDEQVQLRKGTRRLQLKNAMRAKFDRILAPVADRLIAADQRGSVTFDAFFGNTMFHEIAHGLGIKNTVNGPGTVREALRDHASALEEGKADVLGLYMITSLHGQGEIGEAELRDHYVTFLASVFRSIRFGAASAHGRANLACFNFLREMGTVTRDAETGAYRADLGRMREATNALSERILRFQGDGDYDGVAAFLDQYGVIGPELRADLDGLATAGIPVDIVFEQGMDVLGETAVLRPASFFRD
ncbi:MAG: Zn-dependent hydrolase [Acidobacteria bacterium]|nr:Zn-dependent hydrolase [Acidobacteriota bacterium]